jgi:hypothetical protein
VTLDDLLRTVDGGSLHVGLSAPFWYLGSGRSAATTVNAVEGLFVEFLNLAEDVPERMDVPCLDRR